MAGSSTTLRRLLLALASSSAAHFLRLPNEAAEQPHIWPHSMYMNSFTEVVPPAQLAAHLNFTWQHPKGRFGTILAGGPVIDAKGNFYLAGQDAFRKLDPKGRQLWEFRPPAATNNMPALGKNSVLGTDKGGHAFALNMKTGKPIWTQKLDRNAGGDSGYPAAHQGLFVMAAEEGRERGGGGNMRVFALREDTGDVAWQYRVSTPVWNFQPLFTKDNAVVFMDFSGGMTKLRLHDGRLLWHTPAPDSAGSFSDGGAVLGGDMAFSCSNPGTSGGSEGQLGIVRAFRLEDGGIVWQTPLPQPCNSYPAYGPLGAAKAPSVVVTPGSFMGASVMHGSIVALDAATGKEQWHFQAKPFRNLANMARGDVEGFLQRKFGGDPFVNGMCMPAHWGAPVISRDGSVFAGRANGILYRVRGNTSGVGGDVPTDIDFSTSPGVKLEIFDALGCALHGAFAFAPGTMAFQTCDTLFVFKF